MQYFKALDSYQADPSAADACALPQGGSRPRAAADAARTYLRSLGAVVPSETVIDAALFLIRSGVLDIRDIGGANVEMSRV